jgi:predicted O-methyltransferase YrrM
MNPIIESLYETKHAENVDGEMMAIEPASILPEDGEMLYSLIRKKQDGRSLEVGLAFGLASLYMCQGHIDNGGGHHTAIDPYQEKWFRQCGTLNVAKLKFEDSFRFFQQRTHEVLPQLWRDDERFNVIFLDGNHRFEYIMHDFFYASRILEVGGFLMLHDPWMPSTRKATSFILRNLSDEFSLFKESIGPPPSFAGSVYAFAQNVLKNPYDVVAARIFATHRFNNYIVFEKTGEHDIEHCDIHWDFYKPF